MFKSTVTIIKLLLIGSLTISLVIPFANMNIISNNKAMAQRSGYGDNSYSQYPTEEKKYECRTGPFEGFFVSSVEFCKFKFDKDDRKDNNRTGTQSRSSLQRRNSQGRQEKMEPMELMEPTDLMEPMELIEQTLTHVLHVY